MGEQPGNLEELLDRIGQAAEERDRVSLGEIVATVGRGSFGSLLLLAGVITVSPLSGIPGMPTLMGLFVILVAGQMLCGREHFWLPGWLVRRSVKRSRVDKALRWLRRPARFIDRGLKPRLDPMLRRPGLLLIALVCTAIGFTMPPMEIIPFTVNGAGAAITIFGLALIARDGLLALAALALAGLLFGLVFYRVL